MPRIVSVKSNSTSVLSGAALIAVLYFGRDILLPFALSVLLSFLLAPAVERLEQWRVRRIPAVLSIVLLAFLAIGVLAMILANQVYDLAYHLPDYKGNIIAKAQAFQTDKDGVLMRASQALEDVRSRLSVAREETPDVDSGTGPATGDVAKSSAPVESAQRNNLRSANKDDTVDPVPVEIVSGISARDVAQGILGPLVSPLTGAALVLVFVIFMLLEREDLRNRFIQLVGAGSLNLTTNAIDDAASRISRYLLMQLIINSIYGLVIAIGLFLIGLPSALLWGALATALRFVPFIGAGIAAIFPIVLSLAVFDGWTQPALVFALFLTNELVSNNVLEPWLYGSSTGISTIGILASAVFWGWLWGPLGLVMATPLTVCLTVVGRYVPQLAFLNVLLSDNSGLSPSARLYQRLLAMDPEEATEVAEDFLESTSIDELYDSVLLPALHLAELDRHHNDLDEAKERFVLQTVREIIEDLGARSEAAADESNLNTEQQAEAPVDRNNVAPILCLPARDEADELVGLMLVQLLERRGVAARVLSTVALSGEMLDHVQAESAQIVCVSALPPLAATHARYLCKRLRSKMPTLKIVVGLWQSSGITKKSQLRLSAAGMDQRVLTLAEAVKVLVSLSAGQKLTPTPSESSLAAG